MLNLKLWNIYGASRWSGKDFPESQGSFNVFSVPHVTLYFIYSPTSIILNTAVDNSKTFILPIDVFLSGIIICFGTPSFDLPTPNVEGRSNPNSVMGSDPGTES